MPKEKIILPGMVKDLRGVWRLPSNAAAMNSEHWRKAYLRWAEWARRLLLEAGLQPEHGELGDEPARAHLEALISTESVKLRQPEGSKPK